MIIQYKLLSRTIYMYVTSNRPNWLNMGIVGRLLFFFISHYWWIFAKFRRVSVMNFDFDYHEEMNLVPGAKNITRRLSSSISWEELIIWSRRYLKFHLTNFFLIAVTKAKLCAVQIFFQIASWDDSVHSWPALVLGILQIP